MKSIPYYCCLIYFYTHLNYNISILMIQLWENFDLNNIKHRFIDELHINTWSVDVFVMITGMVWSLNDRELLI